MNATPTQRALLFHSLHDAKTPLALSNVWDVASAVVIEAAGAPAIATTSAGVAWSLGVPDGDRLDRARAVSAISAITAAVTVPVTADIEGGLAQAPDGVAETVRAVIEAGAVGINIEDGDRTPESMTMNVAAARRAADAVGLPLYINARTDVFLAGIGDPEQRLTETIERANRYVDAGASGIFVPGIGDAETIAAITSAVSAPINILVGHGALNVSELAALGVARVSLGSDVALAAYAVAQRAATELLATGTYESTKDALAYGTLNSLLS
ncbi:isocitrate lyase/PEP mutase family protein [Aeromicrobium sp. P5_D10]